MFSMASRQDLDNWAELGNKGWGFDDMMHYYRKFETYHPTEDAFAAKVNDKYIDASLRGTSGPIQVSLRDQPSSAMLTFSRFASQAMKLLGCRTCGPRQS
jgi:choline dehydrogenase